jgi:hypothetical protein
MKQLYEQNDEQNDQGCSSFLSTSSGILSSLKHIAKGSSIILIDGF